MVSVLSLIGISLFSLSHKAFHQIVSASWPWRWAPSLGTLSSTCSRKLIKTRPWPPVLPLGHGGILLFFVLENFLQWRHQHSDEHEEIHPVGYLNLVADMAHNFIDGMIIGASYLVSVKLGVATSLAVMLHEIPHEFSNFGILVKSGFTKGRAIFLNFLTALTAVAGAVIAWNAGSGTGSLIHVLIPLTAGGFIYIAGSDLVPQLHKDVKSLRALIQFLAILAGVGIMYLLKFIE